MKLFESVFNLLTDPLDNLIRSFRNRSLPKGDLYSLRRWIDDKRYVKGTNLRDKKVVEAGMRKDWHLIFDDWKLSVEQYEAALISCRGHIPWAPRQYYESHHF